MMFPKFKIALVPSADGRPAVMATISLDVTIPVHHSMRELIERVAHDDWNMVIDQFTGEKIPVHVGEIGTKLLAALDVANVIQPLPADSELVVDSGTFARSISFADLQILENKLKRSCSVRVEGTQLPKQLVFTSGLSEWRLKWSNLKELQAISAELGRRLVEIRDPASPNFIADQDEQDFASEQLTEGQKQAICEIKAFTDMMDRDAQGWAPGPNYEKFKKDTEKCREPTFREGESGGYRGNGGFYK